MDTEIVERLELKIAYLERANSELSDVVYRQQREIDDLREQLRLLKERFEAFRDRPTPYTPEQEKPPHY
jgi:SlyX protein